MAESKAHIDYVDFLQGYARERFPQIICDLIQHDSPESTYPTPSLQGGARPDLYYKYADLIIIGEAKSREDFENKHTKRQIDAYIDELLLNPEKNKHLLYISTIFNYPSIFNYFRNLKRTKDLSDITIHVLGDNLKKAEI